jgi:hypothetical protein
MASNRGYVRVEVTAMEVVASRRHHQLVQELQPLSCMELSVPPRLSIDNIKMVVFRAGVAELRGQHPDRWRLAIQPDPERPPIEFRIEFLVLNKCHPSVSRRCALHETIELLLVPKGLQRSVGVRSSKSSTTARSTHAITLSPRSSESVEAIEKPRVPARYKLQTQSSTQEVWEVDVDQLEVVALAPTGEDLAKQAEYEARVSALQRQLSTQQDQAASREREAAQLRERVQRAETTQLHQLEERAQIAKLAETTAQRLHRAERELASKQQELEEMGARLERAAEAESRSRVAAEHANRAAATQPAGHQQSSGVPANSATAAVGAVDCASRELVALRAAVRRLAREARPATVSDRLDRSALLGLLETLSRELRALSGLSPATPSSSERRRARSSSSGALARVSPGALPELRRSASRVSASHDEPRHTTLLASADYDDLFSDHERLQEEYEFLAQLGEDAHRQFLDEQLENESLRCALKAARAENRALRSTADELGVQLTDVQEELALYKANISVDLPDAAGSSALPTLPGASGVLSSGGEAAFHLPASVFLPPFIMPTFSDDDDDDEEQHGQEHKGEGANHHRYSRCEGGAASGVDAAAEQLALEIEHEDDDEDTKQARSYLRRLRLAKVCVDRPGVVVCGGSCVAIVDRCWWVRLPWGWFVLVSAVGVAVLGCSPLSACWRV